MIKVKKEYIGSTVYLKASNSMYVVTQESANVLWLNGFFEMVEAKNNNKNATPVPKSIEHGGDDTKRTGNGKRTSVRAARKK
jgi:hypothetical protein